VELCRDPIYFVLDVDCTRRVLVVRPLLRADLAPNVSSRVRFSFSIPISAPDHVAVRFGRADRSKQMKTYVLQPFLIGAAGAFGMSVGYAMFDATASLFKRKSPTVR
jgi:hypothetical protein